MKVKIEKRQEIVNDTPNEPTWWLYFTDCGYSVGLQDLALATPELIELRDELNKLELKW